MLAGSALTASGEPITAVFDVRVFLRQAILPTGSTTEPFHQEFPLTLTYDPAQALETLRFGPYGLPSFSPVPLEGATAPGFVPLSGFTQSQIFGSARLVVAAQASRSLVTADAQFLEAVTLSNSGAVSAFASLPPLTAQTFPSYLGLQAPGTVVPNFSFISSLLAVSPVPPQFRVVENYTYLGTATLRQVDPPIIPEPATLALVGGGLALMARRGWRRTRTTRA
jgi:hypothetical protein